MARRRESGLDAIAALPWPVGVVLGIVAYLAIRHGIGWYLSTQGGPLLAGVGDAIAGGVYAPLAWMALVMCWLGALGSFIGSRKRRRLLDTQTGLDSLCAMSWREFEMLVGEAFRRQGYTIQETGLGGADGGVDLILGKHGKTTLVQCKQWKRQRVDVRTVREMYGLLAHHDADAVKVVAVGGYTADAMRFAQGKPIELVHGEALLALITAVQDALHARRDPIDSALEPISIERACPRCSSPMVRRENRRTKEQFWGCSKYPECRETQVVE